MGGRHLLQTTSSELPRRVGFVEQPNLASRCNIAPIPQAPVERRRREPAGWRTLPTLRWGRAPGWAEDFKIGARMVNLRSETVQAKCGESLGTTGARTA